MASIRIIRTKVYGISNYQDAARSVKAGDELTLGRDDQNAHDPNAIGIVNRRRQLLGYINRDMAEDLAPQIDANKLGGLCFASDVTGGGDRYIGVNLVLVIAPIDTPEADMRTAAAEALRPRNSEPNAALKALTVESLRSRAIAPNADLQALAAASSHSQIRKTQPPTPKKPILKPLIVSLCRFTKSIVHFAARLLYRLISIIVYLSKRLISVLADQLGMSPLLVTGIVVVTLVIAIILAIVLSV